MLLAKAITDSFSSVRAERLCEAQQLLATWVGPHWNNFCVSFSVHHLCHSVTNAYQPRWCLSKSYRMMEQNSWICGQKSSGYGYK